MIGVIIVITLLAILLYVDAWCEIRKNTKDIDDLSTKYFIANKSIRDLESRIIFLEKHKQKQDKYNEWIESHPPIKPT